MILRVVEFLDDRGRSPFRIWFERLDPSAAGRATTALYRMEQGNVSSMRSLGGGLEEYRIDAGPGYRIYLGRPDGRTLVVLGAGIKRTQSRDIEASRIRWRHYRQRQQG
jgi:putative addiction module killer protein